MRAWGLAAVLALTAGASEAGEAVRVQRDHPEAKKQVRPKPRRDGLGVRCGLAPA